MDEHIELKVAGRQKSSPVNLRKNGFIPAVLYGKGIANKSLQIKDIDLEKAYQKAGESLLIDLIIDQGKAVKALIKELQRDTVTDKIIHADFYQVNMEDKINTEIDLIFTGVAPAVKELNGILVKNTTKIEVRSLPGDLVKEITVDISPLKTFDDLLFVKDIKMPPKIELVTDANVVVAQVTPPRSDEEISALNEAVKEDVDKIEVAEKKPKEEAAEPAEEPKKETTKK